MSKENETRSNPQDQNSSTAKELKQQTARDSQKIPLKRKPNVIEVNRKAMPTEAQSKEPVAKSDTYKHIENFLESASRELQQTAQQLSALPDLQGAVAPQTRAADADEQVWKINATNPVYAGSVEASPKGKVPLAASSRSPGARVQPLNLPTPLSSPSRNSQTASLPGSARKQVADEYPRSFPVNATNAAAPGANSGVSAKELAANPDIGGLSGWMKRNRELQQALQDASTHPGAVNKSSAAAAKKKKGGRAMLVATSVFMLVLMLTAVLLMGPGAGLLVLPKIGNVDLNEIINIKLGRSASTPPTVAAPVVEPVAKPQPVLEPTPPPPPAPKPRPAPKPEVQPKKEIPKPQPVAKPQPAPKPVAKPAPSNKPVTSTTPSPLQQAMAVVEPYLQPLIHAATPYWAMASQPVADALSKLDPETRTLVLVGAGGAVVLGLGLVLGKRGSIQSLYFGDSCDDGAARGYNTPSSPGRRSPAKARGTAGKGDDGTPVTRPRSSRRLVSEVKETPDGRSARKWSRA